MNRLFLLANIYYARLERLPPRMITSSIWFWLASASLLLFVWFGLMFLHAIPRWFVHKDNAWFERETWRVFASEFLFLAVLAKYSQISRDMKLVRAKRKAWFKGKTLNEYRRALLKRLFRRKEETYLQFAKDISDGLRLTEELRDRSELRLGNIMAAIYASDAKPRIYALLLAVVAAVVTLSVKEGASLETLFQGFAGASLKLLFLLCLQVSLILWVTLYGLKHVFLNVGSLVAYMSVRAGHRRTPNPYTVRYLQRDVLNAHRFWAASSSPRRAE